MTGGLYENTRRQFSSNEDFTKKISHSVFVTNFPDLSILGDYGTNVAYMEGFFNLDRLVKNLCTIWIGSYHLFANQVRYDRPQKPLNPNTNVPQKYGSKKDADHRNGSTGSHQKKGGVTSYVSVVNGVTPLVQPGNSLSSAPALVLDEECVVERDFSNCEVNQDFVSDERVVWLDIEGVPLYAWSRKSFDKIGSKEAVEEIWNVSPSLSHPPGVLASGSLISSDKELNKEFSPTISARNIEQFQVVHEDVSFNSVGESWNDKGGSVLGSVSMRMIRYHLWDVDPKVKLSYLVVTILRPAAEPSLRDRDGRYGFLSSSEEANVSMGDLKGDENRNQVSARFKRLCSLDEIRLAVWGCGMSIKSPGPDGFLLNSLEKIWKRPNFGVLEVPRSQSEDMAFFFRLHALLLENNVPYLGVIGAGWDDLRIGQSDSNWKIPFGRWEVIDTFTEIIPE
ncbi:hypothetical protein Tco_0412326 [Tanacetum coccineum]